MACRSLLVDLNVLGDVYNYSISFEMEICGDEAKILFTWVGQHCEVEDKWIVLQFDNNYSETRRDF